MKEAKSKNSNHYKSLLVDIKQHVATVTLNRPEIRNAFNDEMIAELTEAFTVLGADDDVRVIVLAAAGKAFCAGADLNWMRAMADYSYEENLADADKLAQMLKTIYECPKPTIAAIQGDVYAGGMGLVAVCDVAIAVKIANFCLSEVRLGLAPATISPYVIRAMGARAAQRYFLSAEVFDAKKARQLGFIHERVSEEWLDDEVTTLCAKMVKNSPDAVKTCKQLLHDVAGAPITDELIADTVKGIADIRASTQGKEGVQAFLQKRKPDWLTAN
ncbi:MULTISPECIES: enoyl-CoA hydratase/isomerase family protein [Psychrobacter]|jgi:methylglutaconyl-CoA hydratase|uniref:Enoyl-CoA hydratase n=1 Tax=Psychrobacter pocilloporae TaxID=1775882 RepID=A0ABT6IQ90_9GAMM|nr:MULTISPECIES: enoyl-CoA hydratase/isomerase family protein [Psychrobacter]MDH4903997.1 enoyl-CoA hydratase [Psychrobacter pocilloporae]BBI66363.1 enoyl-CoA hydratase [Psychrobacter sp. KH172YL61]